MSVRCESLRIFLMNISYDETKSTFPTTSCIRQDGQESPFLLNLFIEYVMRVFMEKCTKDENIKFFEHKYSINGRTISREQRLSMRHLNIKLNGTSILHGVDMQII